MSDPSHPPAQLIERMLSVLVGEILAETRDGVAAGNKLFGAAVLRRDDLSLVVVGRNDETRSPLMHGEVACLERFWALPADRRPDPAACLFLSSHEPCSLCLSAITWSGFDNFSYLFSYEETRDAFAIPHDLRILREVFGVEDGAYRADNAYWRATDLQALIEGSDGDREGWRARVAALRRAYGALSERYQAGKAGNAIPLD